MGKVRWAFVGVAVGLACVGASAQRESAPVTDETGTPIRPKGAGDPTVLVDVIGETIEARDGTSDEPVLMPRKLKLYYDYKGQSLKPAVEVRAHDDGFDLVYRFVNDTGEPRSLGALGVGFFTLGPKVTYLAPTGAVGERLADIKKFESDSFVYPTRAYSPVMALRNDRYAVGVSVLYPVEEYKHDVRVSLVNADEVSSEALPGGRGWAVDVRLSNCGDERDEGVLKHSAMMKPGEEREYTVAVRVTKRPAEWIRTLTPYRDYFAARYGGVSYERDPRPVMPWSIAEASSQNPQNPLGFFGPVQWRPDLFGWSQLVKSINLNSASFGRLMLMAPSGLYPTQTANNPPFQMTTPWKQNPQLIQALDPERGLRGLMRNRRQVGLWWGSSIQVSRTWDSPSVETLDPSNPLHRELAFAEMDVAIETGIRTVALGNCSRETMPAWEIAGWIGVLRERYPSVKFVVSPMACDLVHAVAPGVVQGWDEGPGLKSVNDYLAVRSPHYLADFLLPGHETWASFQYSGHRTKFKVQPTVATVLKDMRQVAGHGYVPFFLELGGDGKQIRAAATWERTVPQDLWSQGDNGSVAAEGSGYGDRVDVRVAEGDEAVISDGSGEITRISKPLVAPGKAAPGKARPKAPAKKPSKTAGGKSGSGKISGVSGGR